MKTTRSDAATVLRAFAALGIRSFGGPVAHIGYFRRAFVVRKQWLTEQEFADLVTLTQTLPGPASSQLGFAIGWKRGGWLGACAAFIGFTLPSFLLMFAFSQGQAIMASPAGTIMLVALRWVAVVVVANAIWKMARRLAPDLPRVGIAVLAAALALTFGAAGQLLAIAAGGAAGLLLRRRLPTQTLATAVIHVPMRVAHAALGTLATGLVVLPMAAAATHSGLLTLTNAFFRSGALVFGGGHVVLPLLQASIVDPGWVDPQTFLAGYGAAQALPGPLFSFAAFLGAAASIGPGGLGGAALATLAIFLPGFLLLVGALPYWSRLRSTQNANAVLAGVGAVVVGLLAVAWVELIVLVLG